MARLIVTTCGTSLLESSCWSSNDPCLQQISSLDRKDANYPSKKRNMQKQWYDEISKYIGKSAVFIKEHKFVMECWKNNTLIDLPAELASLKGILNYFNKKSNPITEDDKIILYYADNREAIFCAEVLHQVITQNTLLPIKEERIIIEKIDKLNPEKVNDFNEGINNLLKKVESQCTNGSEIIFNLTAGYKGLTIVLSGLAQRRNIPIFYLFEEAGYDNIFVVKFTSDGKIDFEILTSSGEIIQSHGGPIT